MSQWLQMLGHATERINALNIVHIAGTKGKGSTCAFTESFLRAHGRRTGFPSRTGLYTSPHLIEPEERIRVNAQPLDRDLFAKYFFEVYDRLPQLSDATSDEKTTVVERGPRFLQLYALLAFHVFISENVDVAVVETHSGGEYDATNVIEQPIVTAITILGLDHVDMLGPTIENIAWHKAGIFKPGAVALSTMQDVAPAKVLERRSADKGEHVQFIGEDSRLPKGALPLKPSVQKENASLAVAATEAWLAARSPVERQTLTQEDIDLGVQQWCWPGRFQIVQAENVAWFLDAAHNEMSVQIAAQWFVEAGKELDASTSADQVLVFSHISESRDAVGLLQALAIALEGNGAQISHVVFTTYDESEQKKGYKPPNDCGAFHEVWRQVFPETIIWDRPTVQGARDLVESLAAEQQSALRGLQTLVTGSQHLVGPMLKCLQNRGPTSKTV
ncbi:uncharacterized protein LTR77_000891 [Saxophila tyrrhenica]|uniref:tetrahydrofolate synthase n=1 Tax=Saxophila tyrrhenica TaxID=1690608 RepID=A0AAV9PSF3_9PEZI|nr:hypothetical protein LTR77_000891 [Saxophila tyrrhenica]